MKSFLRLTAVAIVGLALILPSSSFAQDENWDADQVWTNYYHYALHDVNLEEAEGSPYMTDTFLPGKVFFSGNVRNSGMLLRYNIYTDVIEVKDAAKEADEPDNSLLKRENVTAEIAGRKFVYASDFEKEDGSRGAYLELVEPGKGLTLYLRHTADFRDKIMPRNSYERIKPAKFSQYTTYYIYVKGEGFTEISQRESKFAKQFGDYKKALKQYMKDNNIDLSEEKDLIKTFNYLDSLM